MGGEPDALIVDVAEAALKSHRSEKDARRDKSRTRRQHFRPIVDKYPAAGGANLLLKAATESVENFMVHV